VPGTGLVCVEALKRLHEPVWYSICTRLTQPGHFVGRIAFDRIVFDVWHSTTCRNHISAGGKRNESTYGTVTCCVYMLQYTSVCLRASASLSTQETL
jgi:hypothetical protein